MSDTRVSIIGDHPTATPFAYVPAIGDIVAIYGPKGFAHGSISEAADVGGERVAPPEDTT